MTATNSITELPLMGDAVSYQSFKAKVLVNLVNRFMVPVIRLQAYSSSITRKCFLFVPRYVTALISRWIGRTRVTAATESRFVSTVNFCRLSLKFTYLLQVKVRGFCSCTFQLWCQWSSDSLAGRNRAATRITGRVTIRRFEQNQRYKRNKSKMEV